MPSAKINVAHLLDHGPLAAPATAVSALRLDTTATTELSPGESTAEVMKIAKTVSLAANFNPALAKLVLKATTPAQIATALINARHSRLGGNGGVLGKATTPVKPCPDGKGFFRHHTGGSIYWSPYTGAHDVRGPIRQLWSSLGWEKSALGYPRSGESEGRDTRHEGRFNHFSGGSIYWHPATGAHAVYGSIRRKYLELGAEASVLGYPRTDQQKTPDGKGRYNHFQAGSIYTKGGTGAHEVHGLIRQLWAQLGWERNPQLGYPISDELIPHRGIGYTRPANLRKPLLDQPLEVVRLPAGQPSPTINLATIGLLTPPPGAAIAPAAGFRAATVPAAVIANPALVQPAAGAVLRPGVIVKPPVIINPAASHKGQSQDRYADFENGVLFWRRGATAAVQLRPRAKAPNGNRMAWTANEIVQFASAKIRAAIGTIPGAATAGIGFIGTTGYTWDGAGVRNRAHRIRAVLQGMRRVGIAPVSGVATVEIECEVSFDPVDREINGFLTDWKIESSQGDFIGGGSLERVLHQRLDPVLFQQFLITKVPATKEDPIAVLSVKTQTDGDVVVYFEP